MDGRFEIGDFNENRDCFLWRADSIYTGNNDCVVGGCGRLRQSICGFSFILTYEARLLVIVYDVH